MLGRSGRFYLVPIQFCTADKASAHNPSKSTPSFLVCVFNHLDAFAANSLHSSFSLANAASNRAFKGRKKRISQLPFGGCWGGGGGEGGWEKKLYHS